MKQKRLVGLSETVEVAITNIQAREYKFSDNETTLQNVVLLGIAVHTDAIALAPTSGRAVLPLAEMKKGYLELVDKKGVSRNKDFPLEVFFGNENVFTYVKPFLVDLPKCKIKLPNSQALVLPTVPVPGYSIVVTLLYEPFNPDVHKTINGTEIVSGDDDSITD